VHHIRCPNGRSWRETDIGEVRKSRRHSVSDASLAGRDVFATEAPRVRVEVLDPAVRLKADMTSAIGDRVIGDVVARGSRQ